MATTRKPKSPPDPQGPIVDKDGRPTKEFYEWYVAITAWAKQVDATIA